ncbi:DUF3006 family protein [Candidatus Fermentibacteria bacterium]|nr:DUF3006 family protein [Candidatus Fermentibacteria bacterium]
MPGETELLVSVDRIEDGTAVLVSREAHRWLLPAHLLPEGCSEGDVLRITLRRDPEETERLRRKIGDLQERLRNRSGENGG